MTHDQAFRGVDWIKVIDPHYLAKISREIDDIRMKTQDPDEDQEVGIRRHLLRPGGDGY